MRALSIRQPYAELILRGIKTVELRSISTTIIGERFYIYASRRAGLSSAAVWSRDLSTLRAPLPPWMIELAEQVKLIEPDEQGGLPTGVIVGTAEVARCELLMACGALQVDAGGSGTVQATSNQQQATRMYAWHLTDVQRAKTFRKPKKHPQPVWFNPF